MRRALSAAAAALIVAAACGGGEDPRGEEVFRGRLARVVEDPASFDGRRVVVRAYYVAELDQTVLTVGLAESYPPQAIEPRVWVTALEPEDGCLSSDAGVTWGEVLADGRFRYDPEGRLGPLGVWTMELQDAGLRCP